MAAIAAQTDRIACLVSYDGTGYHGFQSQKIAVPTVQGEISAALRTILRYEVKVEGAGRTDAGVHALRQVIAFSAPKKSLLFADAHSADAPAGDEDERYLERLRHSLSRMLAPGIAVNGIRRVPRSFDPRRDASAREYIYLLLASRADSPFLYRRAHRHPGTLDAAAMSEAAAHLVGLHDFASFCTAEATGIAEDKLERGVGRGTERRVLAAQVTSVPVEAGALLVMRFEADAFLHSMVRTMVGTLIEVGAGRRRPGDVPAILAGRDRALAGATAPPQGLYLTGIRYAPGIFDEAAPLGAGGVHRLLNEVAPC